MMPELHLPSKCPRTVLGLESSASFSASTLLMRSRVTQFIEYLINHADGPRCALQRWFAGTRRTAATGGAGCAPGRFLVAPAACRPLSRSSCLLPLTLHVVRSLQRIGRSQALLRSCLIRPICRGCSRLGEVLFSATAKAGEALVSRTIQLRSACSITSPAL